jgi:L-asparaginase II
VIETASAAASTELAVVTRNGFVESRHIGSVAVVNPAGELIYSLGAPEELVLPRSAMKPFIATAIMASGVELEGAQAAIATSSHSGSEQHVLLVRELLKRAGLSDDALQCPRDMPHDKALRTLMIRREIGPSPLFHCCSGKHAAMLLACAVNDWPTESYLELDHPLQQRIIEVMQRLIGAEITVSAVDGCGAPVHAMSLVSLARGIRTLVSSSLTSPFAMFRAGAELTQAMLANPVIVGAVGEPDTVLMHKLGMVAKTGYEGIFVASASDGTTAAVKVLDGNLRASALIAATALVRAGALTQMQLDSVTGDLDLTVFGGGKPVGEIQNAF